MTWNHLTTLKTFLNEPAEVHSFSFGFYSVFFSLINIPDKNKEEIQNEYPYFMAGRFIGMIFILILMGVIISKL